MSLKVSKCRVDEKMHVRLTRIIAEVSEISHIADSLLFSKHTWKIIDCKILKLKTVLEIRRFLRTWNMLQNLFTPYLIFEY